MKRDAGKELDEEDDEEACGPASWAAYARHWFKWLAYMMAFSLVLLPTDRYLECRLGKGLAADVLTVALAVFLLFIIVWVDRRLSRIGC